MTTSIISPPSTEHNLDGITRRTLLQLAREDLNVPIVERPIGRTELYTADEVFLSGTGVQIAEVISIDDRPIGDGEHFPVVAALQSTYFEAVRGLRPPFSHWLTQV